MTKEELEKEADKYADDYATPDLDCSFRVYMFEASKEAYLAAAEPREKRIAELIALINAERERQEKCDDIHLRKIAELEKENAELKEYNKYLKRKRQGGIQKQYNKVAIIKQQDDQLTKAKELLKEFIHHYKAKTIYIENMQDLLEQAEQFIKDSEVEK